MKISAYATVECPGRSQT